MGKALRLEPAGGQPWCRPDHAEGDRCRNDEIDPLHSAYEIADTLRCVCTGFETGQFAIQRRGQARVKENQPSLEQGEYANQSIGLHSEIADIERDEQEPHDCRPGAPDKIGGDISSYNRHGLILFRYPSGATVITSLSSIVRSTMK